MEDRTRGEFSHYDVAATEATSGPWAEKRRLASAMRQVIQRLVEIDAPEAELAQAADRLESYAEHLATHPMNKRYTGWAEASTSGDVAAFFDQSPLIGLANPLAPPIKIEADAPDEAGGAPSCKAWVVFGSAYEGPPGSVHGGFVAAAFDEVLGFANSLSGSPGMTARLIVNYRQPTPLYTELRFDARLDRVEGRKIFTTGEVYAGDRLTAEAEGLFVSVDREKFQRLFETRKQHFTPKG